MEILIATILICTFFIYLIYKAIKNDKKEFNLRYEQRMKWLESQPKYIISGQLNNLWYHIEEVEAVLLSKTVRYPAKELAEARLENMVTKNLIKLNHGYFPATNFTEFKIEEKK